MDAEFRRRYYASRDLASKPFAAFCYAPFVSMYLDQWGFVRACCQNWTGTLGNVAHERLPAIWRGPRAAALRGAVRSDDLSQGCQYCAWQVADGEPSVVFARNFDRLPLASADTFWPGQMEFSVTNACNLECVMCNGEWSSRIRTGRERLPPLPKPYGDEFFHDLVEFLPHLQQAKFLGGEPLVSPEAFRIWDLMIEHGPQVECHVTTNGTQLNPRVERAMANLKMSFSVSFDGATASTVEAVRRGARYEEIVANFQRFHAYARARQTYIGLTYCLMPQNWQEFGDFLLFADDWDCEVIVNTVLHPADCSLYHLPGGALADIVAALERQGTHLVPRLGRNRQRWEDELSRLRHRALHADQSLAFIPRRWAERFLAQRDQQAPANSAAALETVATGTPAAAPTADRTGDSLRLRLDDQDQVVAVASVPHQEIAIVADDLVGRSLDHVCALLRIKLGGIMQLDDEWQRDDEAGCRLTFTDAALVTSAWQVTVVPCYDANGQRAGTWWTARWLPPAAGHPMRASAITPASK